MYPDLVILDLGLPDIDGIDFIKTIRESYDDAKERLMERFGFSDVQAQSVLDMRLVQLQKLNGEKIEDEYNELISSVYKDIIIENILLTNLSYFMNYSLFQFIL